MWNHMILYDMVYKVSPCFPFQRKSSGFRTWWFAPPHVTVVNGLEPQLYIYISLQAWLISYNPHTITGVNQQNGRQKKTCSFLLKSNNRTYLHIIEHHLIIFNSVQYLWFLHVAIDLGPLLFDHAKHQRSHLRFQRVFLRFAPTSVISLIDRLGLWENLQKTMVFARTYTRGCCKILELVELCWSEHWNWNPNQFQCDNCSTNCSTFDNTKHG